MKQITSVEKVKIKQKLLDIITDREMSKKLIWKTWQRKTYKFTNIDKDVILDLLDELVDAGYLKIVRRTKKATVLKRGK